jgi:hypothetical protein
MAKSRAIFQAGLGAWACLMRRISAPVRVVVSLSVADRAATSSPVAAWAAGVARMSPAEAAARTMAVRDRALSFHAADRVS